MDSVENTEASNFQIRFFSQPTSFHEGSKLHERVLIKRDRKTDSEITTSGFRERLPTSMFANDFKIAINEEKDLG